MSLKLSSGQQKHPSVPPVHRPFTHAFEGFLFYACIDLALPACAATAFQIRGSEMINQQCCFI